MYHFHPIVPFMFLSSLWFYLKGELSRVHAVVVVLSNAMRDFQLR